MFRKQLLWKIILIDKPSSMIIGFIRYEQTSSEIIKTMNLPRAFISSKVDHMAKKLIW